MTDQIYQNVDAIVAYLLRQLLIGEVHTRQPVIGIRHQTSGHFIVMNMVVVAKYFDLRFIVIGQYRLNKITH